LTTEPGGFPEENVTLLLDADKASILKALRKVSRKSDRDDLVLFFYSGQEAVLDDRFYLLASDGERATSPGNLAFSEIEEVLGAAAAETVVAVLDTCRTGRARFSPGFKPQSFVLSAAGVGGTHIDDPGPGGAALEAQPEGEVAYGFFTEALVEGLAGAADRSGDDRITVLELAAFVAPRVQETTRGGQTPTVGAEFSCDPTLVVLSAD
jgi:uncharacterized caspase-like protein